MYTKYLSVSEKPFDEVPQEVFKVAGVNYFFEERKSSGYARNCGQTHAKGKYYKDIDSNLIK